MNRWRSSGIANSSHQTATVTNEARIACSGPANPNNGGFEYIATLMTSSTPPPR